MSPRQALVKRLGPGGIRAWVETLTEEELSYLPYAWREFWARPNQLAPLGDWFVWLLLAGRGFGKTRTGAEWVRERVDKGARSIALVAKTPDHARDVMIEGKPGVPGLLGVFPPSQRPLYQPGLRRVVFHTGAIATTYSGAEPDQLRGPSHDTGWADEMAAWMYVKETWDNLVLTMRLESAQIQPQVCVTTTPKPVTIIRQLRKRPNVRETGGSTYENADNLPASWFAELRQTYEGTALGQQELYAAVLDEMPGALWTRERIQQARIKDIPVDKLAPAGAYSRRLKLVPALRRIAVAIDPAVTADEESNETGIIAGAIDTQSPPHAYIFADLSGRWSPEVWGRYAVGILHALQGDRIIAETNQGGLLVERNLRVIAPNVPYKGVHATQGKRTRAEPVAALYEQGRIHHVGVFPELEDQLCTWLPGEASPDRLDALVWLLWDLLVADEMVLIEALQVNF